MVITKEEFLKRLQEDKNFTKIEELVEFALPVVQYYLNNYQGKVIVDNTRIGGKIETIDFSEITINIPTSQIGFQKLYEAYKSLVHRIEEFK